MLNKVLGYGVVIVLLVALVGGTAYVLTRPAEAQAERGALRGASLQAEGGNRGGGRAASGSAAVPGGRGNGGQGMNEGYGGGQTADRDNGGGQGAGGGYGAGQSTGNRQPIAETEVHDWLTLQGTVTVADNELTVQTADGEVVVGLGQAWYRDEAGFVVNVGDEVVVQGYYEDGEFKAGTVENLTTGATVTLRDATGRPMWAGRGNGQNRP